MVLIMVKWGVDHYRYLSGLFYYHFHIKTDSVFQLLCQNAVDI